ncbi:MAG: hypothetical protein WCI55_06930 [Armatimonadota bacterium]
MMNSTRFLAVGGMLLVTSAAFAQTAADWQKKLDSYTAAYKRKDTKAMTAFVKANFGPDFRFIPLKGGPINADQWLAKEIAQATMAEKTTVFDMKVQVAQNSAAYATAITSNRLTAQTKMEPNGKVGIFDFAYKGTVQADLKNGKVIIHYIRVISGKKTFDGKVLPK